MSTNVEALEETLQCLAGTRRIEAADAAQVQALRSMAAALDADPSKAALWREYLDALAEVRRTDDDAGKLDELIAEIGGAAPVGDETAT